MAHRLRAVLDDEPPFPAGHGADQASVVHPTKRVGSGVAGWGSGAFDCLEDAEACVCEFGHGC